MKNFATVGIERGFQRTAKNFGGKYHYTWGIFCTEKNGWTVHTRNMRILKGTFDNAHGFSFTVGAVVLMNGVPVMVFLGSYGRTYYLIHQSNTHTPVCFKSRSFDLIKLCNLVLHVLIG